MIKEVLGIGLLGTVVSCWYSVWIILFFFKLIMHIKNFSLPCRYSWNLSHACPSCRSRQFSARPCRTPPLVDRLVSVRQILPSKFKLFIAWIAIYFKLDKKWHGNNIIIYLMEKGDQWRWGATVALKKIRFFYSSLLNVK